MKRKKKTFFGLSILSYCSSIFGSCQTSKTAKEGKTQLTFSLFNNNTVIPRHSRVCYRQSQLSDNNTVIPRYQNVC
jgi:hypothetical protein